MYLSITYACEHYGYAGIHIVSLVVVYKRV